MDMQEAISVMGDAYVCLHERRQSRGVAEAPCNAFVVAIDEREFGALLTVLRDVDDPDLAALTQELLENVPPGPFNVHAPIVI